MINGAISSSKFSKFLVQYQYLIELLWAQHSDKIAYLPNRVLSRISNLWDFYVLMIFHHQKEDSSFVCFAFALTSSVSSNSCFTARFVKSVSELTENSVEHDVDAPFAVKGQYLKALIILAIAV